MAFVQDFEHDIFVSYVRGPSADDPGAAWVDRAVAHLSIAIRRRTGRVVDIHLDRRQLLSAQGRAELSRQIARSALFLAFVSPGYFADERARRELEAALSAESNVQRIVIVERLPPGPDEAPPAALAGFRTFAFWEADAASGDAVPLSPDRNRAEFMRRIDDLAEPVARHLLGMTGAVHQRAPAPAADVAEPAARHLRDVGRAEPPPAGAIPTAAGASGPPRPARSEARARLVWGLLLLVTVGAAAWFFRDSLADLTAVLGDVFR